MKYDMITYILCNVCFPQSVRISRSSEQLPPAPPLSASPGESFSPLKGTACSGARGKVRSYEHARTFSSFNVLSLKSFAVLMRTMDKLL